MNLMQFDQNPDSLSGPNFQRVYIKKYMVEKKNKENVRRVRTVRENCLTRQQEIFTTNVKSNQGGIVQNRQIDQHIDLGFNPKNMKIFIHDKVGI